MRVRSPIRGDDSDEVLADVGEMNLRTSLSLRALREPSLFPAHHRHRRTGAHSRARARGVARRIVGLNDIGEIRDQLRLIWNARRVADVATVESQLFEIMPPAAVARHLKRFDRAIRALDRPVGG